MERGGLRGGRLLVAALAAAGALRPAAGLAQTISVTVQVGTASCGTVTAGDQFCSDNPGASQATVLVTSDAPYEIVFEDANPGGRCGASQVELTNAQGDYLCVTIVGNLAGTACPAGCTYLVWLDRITRLPSPLAAGSYSGAFTVLVTTVPRPP